MGFKEDAVFARLLSIGVYAAGAITDDLEKSHGHRIIELERYAKANKVWETKVKRARLADLLCVRCGRRFEAKGKTKLEIKLSDSTAEGRAWRDGGMRLDDVFAFARVDMDTTPVAVSSFIYVTRQDLETALPSSKEGKRKSASEGSELDRVWPMWVPKDAGIVTEVIDTDNARKIKVTYKSGKRYTYIHAKNWKNFYSLAENMSFEVGQPIASTFNLANVKCPGDIWEWQENLTAESEDDLFPAVKAARFLGPAQAEGALLNIALDDTNSWRVQLEAHASLAAQRPESVHVLKQIAQGEDSGEGECMEAVFALSEIGTDEAVEALFDVARSGNPVISEEVRAAAAWGLGTGARKAPEKLMLLLHDASVQVATHAAAVMPDQLPEASLDELRSWLVQDDPRQAATAAHLLAGRGRVPELVDALKEAPESVRQLTVLALGDSPREAVQRHLEDLDELSRAGVTTLWARKHDWLRQPETDGILAALQEQMLRQ
ncbi:HEAT repeat domain-containing protein [Kocuria sp. U4B]